MGKWWTGGLGPVDVGNTLRIVPYWDCWRTESDRLNIVVDPGASFGSGDHPTTLIALELLEKTINQMAGRPATAIPLRYWDRHRCACHSR